MFVILLLDICKPLLLSSMMHVSAFLESYDDTQKSQQATLESTNSVLQGVIKQEDRKQLSRFFVCFVVDLIIAALRVYMSDNVE